MDTSVKGKPTELAGEFKIPIELVKEEVKIIKEFQEFRRKSKSLCKAIRLTEVAEFVLFKLEKL